MAFWDDEIAATTITTKKKIWRVELLGDLDGNFAFKAHLVKVKDDAGVIVETEVLADIETTYDAAFADPALEPSITKIRNGCRALVRAIRTA